MRSALAPDVPFGPCLASPVPESTLAMMVCFPLGSELGLFSTRVHGRRRRLQRLWRATHRRAQRLHPYLLLLRHLRRLRVRIRLCMAG
jgi:hypothetical protein